MEAFELALMLLAAVLLSSVIDQLVPKISSPLIQIGIGAIIASLAVSPIEINFDPELFLVLFIAPLLFDEARTTSKAALWKNKGAILSLALGLVVAIVLVVGFSLHFLIPSIPLAAAFALGAALGPTDAIAVSSLSEEAALSPRQKSLLSGESLINDASGVVSFQFAIMAAVTGTFSLLDAGITFFSSFLGGIGLGILLGFIGTSTVNKVRKMGLENTTFHVLFEVFTPFIVYLIAQSLQVSGILAVVAAGLVGSFSPRIIGPTISRINIVSSNVWKVLSFALNGIVFVLLGMQIPPAMQSSWDSVAIGNLELIGYVLALTLLVSSIRFIWILVMERVRKDTDTKKRRKLSKTILKEALITTLSGPKGAITLSIAFTIPIAVSSGASFPQRNLLIFLASGVILCTLLLATFVVPLLAPKKEKDTEKAADVARVTVEILRTVIERLANKQTDENHIALQSVIQSYNKRIARIQSINDFETEPHRELRIKVLRRQQDYVISRIENETVDLVSAYKYIQRLVRVQNLLTHHRNNTWILRNALRHLRITLQVLGRIIIDKTPGAQRTELSESMRTLQIDSEKVAIDLLKKELAHDQFASENASVLLVEHERVLRALQQQGSRPSIATLARSANVATEIEREGLQLELEQIQEAYENEWLGRSAAKQLRENVYLMQIDLEDKI